MEHLTRAQLADLTLRWEFWEAEASTPARRLARARMHLLFLLIRHGGLRLREAIGLDARATLNVATGMLRVPGPNAREILLPLAGMRHMRRILSLEAAAEPDFLRLDQGFVRRTFYAAAEPLGLDPNVAGPRALRCARGLELLAQRVPLELVQHFLGLDTPAQLAAFLDFSGSAGRALVRARMTERSGTDAPIIGMVEAVTPGLRMARVDVLSFSDVRVTARLPLKEFLRLEIRPGVVVGAAPDPAGVVLGTEPVPGLANCLEGVVAARHRDPAETFVTVETADGLRLNPSLETDVADRLGIVEGMRVCASFPARGVRLVID